LFEDPPQPAEISATATSARNATGRIYYFTLKLTFALAPALLWSLFASRTDSVCLPLGRPL
jgi:hypothetical protein